MTDLVCRAADPCLILIDNFDKGADLLRAAELQGLRERHLEETRCAVPAISEIFAYIPGAK